MAHEHDDGILRWVLLPIVAAIAFYGAVVVTIVAIRLVEGFCPPELVVSGSCQATWWPTVQQTILAAGAGLGAVLIILVFGERLVATVRAHRTTRAALTAPRRSKALLARS